MIANAVVEELGEPDRPLVINVSRLIRSREEKTILPNSGNQLRQSLLNLEKSKTELLELLVVTSEKI